MNEHLGSLRDAYDFDAPRRNQNELEGWRTEVIDDLLTRTGPEATILDLGAGTGQNAAYIAAAGHTVLAVDLSPTSVELARERGLDARIGDFTAADFDVGVFDGVLAMNSLLHVPKRLFPQALRAIRRSLHRGGLAVIVVWGGRNHEGTLDDDWTKPARFFAFYSDDDFARLPTPGFNRVSCEFRHDQLDGDSHPQVMVLEAV